ncbi:MAG: MFS transporter, partial [Flavobacteriaceae bacterium]|nr:MFS transporter [Flavobacteriaceae bacterium]
TLSFGAIYKYFLGGNAVNAMLFAGAFFAIAAILAMRLNVKKAKLEVDEEEEEN